MDIITVLILVFFSILCGVVANNKNRDIVLWVVLGILFGIFSFIILLFLPKIEQEQK